MGTSPLNHRSEEQVPASTNPYFGAEDIDQVIAKHDDIVADILAPLEREHTPLEVVELEIRAELALYEEKPTDLNILADTLSQIDTPQGCLDWAALARVEAGQWATDDEVVIKLFGWAERVEAEAHTQTNGD